MAHKMNRYKKYVFTRGGEALDWSNAELVPVRDEGALLAFVEELKAQPGRDIHVSGGAQLARTLIRLGVVDRYRLFVHPWCRPARAGSTSSASSASSTWRARPRTPMASSGSTTSDSPWRP
jgi:dihydrofolate reductase